MFRIHPWERIFCGCILAVNRGDEADLVCDECHRAYLRRKRIWNYFAKGELVSVLDDPKYPSKTETVGAMFKDATNYFLLIGLGLIALAFCYRDSLSAFLPVLAP